MRVLWCWVASYMATGYKGAGGTVIGGGGGFAGCSVREDDFSLTTSTTLYATASTAFLSM